MKHTFTAIAGLVLIGTTAYGQQLPARVVVPPVLDNFTLLDVPRVPFITETGDLIKSQARRDAQRDDQRQFYPAPRPYRSNDPYQLNWGDPDEER